MGTVRRGKDAARRITALVGLLLACVWAGRAAAVAFAQAGAGSVASSPPTVPVVNGLPYLDNRSSGEQVVLSYYNAINRGEYARAYSYWAAPLSSVGSYQSFAQGYANTTFVQVTTGIIQMGAGAGQRYFSVPLSLAAWDNNGNTQHYIGCYVAHLGLPVLQAVPPFQPIQIERATVWQAANGPATLDQACPNQGQPLPPSSPFAQEQVTVNAGHYVDDRSAPQAVLRSFYNAINRSEYARAYSYWDEAAQNNRLPSFSAFQQGYQHTSSVDLHLGDAMRLAQQGQLIFQLPATIIAHQDDGSTQTYVGCYTLQLTNPARQSSPPYRPLSLDSASIQSVPAFANTDQLMSQSCR